MERGRIHAEEKDQEARDFSKADTSQVKHEMELAQNEKTEEVDKMNRNLKGVEKDKSKEERGGFVVVKDWKQEFL